MRTDLERMVEQGVMRVSQVADFLAVSRPTVYRLMANGELPYMMIGCGRRIPRAAVIRLAVRNMCNTDTAREK